MPLVESFSGIRGIYGKELDDRAAVKYAHSYITLVRKKSGKKAPTIVIGMDPRPSGSALKNAMIGIIDCNFIDVGVLPTPAIEFAVRHFNADGGVIITASHNEPFWNGFKFLSDDGAVLGEKDMGLVISGTRFLKDFHKIQERKILERHNEALKRYEEFVFGIVGLDNVDKIRQSKQRIVLDPNGGAGIIAKQMLENAGVEVIGANMNYGEFNRQVEPTEDALVYLKNVIDEGKADFAAGFDCDADRVEILMETGQLLSGNYILAIVVDEILSNAKSPKGQAVVVNDATSGIVREIVQKHGAKIKEVEVGETNVVEEMKRLRSVVGGEGSSGGAVVAPSRCRDGILTLLMILSITAKRGKKLHEIADEMPQYHNLRKKINFNPDKHDAIKKFLKSHYLKKGFDIRETGGIKGGLKAMRDCSFVWFRASKTESNVFRIISDSSKRSEAEGLLDEAVSLFKKAIKQ